jgi:hypothetical protein
MIQIVFGNHDVFNFVKSFINFLLKFDDAGFYLLLAAFKFCNFWGELC